MLTSAIKTNDVMELLCFPTMKVINDIITHGHGHGTIMYYYAFLHHEDSQLLHKIIMYYSAFLR
jgi:hypothetical protein